MAINANDEKHAAQIEAGIAGRKRGHLFEKLLASKINSISSLDWLETTEGHLFKGKPEILLLNYVVTKLSVKDVTRVVAYSTGGHATGEGGDIVLLDSGTPLLRAKSDMIIEVFRGDESQRIGISIKTCSKKSPTNDQLYCSTADAFCNLLLEHNLPVSAVARKALKMFCGDVGFRPLDNPQVLRTGNVERWFWEELPAEAREEWAYIFTDKQKEITRLLLSKAYKDDPYPPHFIFHQTRLYNSCDDMEIAMFTVEELVEYSCRNGGFSVVPYTVKKGRFKDPNITHYAPRFGFVQFQRLGNKQNATQLQFNLQAGYFYKIL